MDEIRQNLLEYMEVLIPDSRGSQHLPIWAASACRTMPHPLRWQHNSSLVFWSHAFTSIQQCSIIQIMCRCKDDKANPCHVMSLVMVVVFEDCPALLIVIFILSRYKEKANHALDSSFSNGSILINTHGLLTCIVVLLISTRLLSEIHPTRKNSCIACGICVKGITCGTCMTA